MYESNAFKRIKYRSWNGYNDELVWSALWLHKATGDASYLTKAQSYYDEFGLEGEKGVFSWDDKVAGKFYLEDNNNELCIFQHLNTTI